MNNGNLRVVKKGGDDDDEDEGAMPFELELLKTTRLHERFTGENEDNAMMGTG